MELEYIEEFTYVAKYANLSVASKELHISQPVLSRHIKSIEVELGHELFDYKSTPGSLTPFGKEFLEYACRVANESMRMKAFARTYRKNPTTVIRVQGVIDAVTMPVIRSLEKRLNERDVAIEIRTADRTLQTTFDDVCAGNLDIAIEPLSELLDARGLSSAHIATEDSYIVMEKSNAFASKESISSDDLPKMSFVFLHTNSDYAMRRHLKSICRRLDMVGDIPLGLTLSPANTYDELLLHGLKEQFLILPKSLALRYAQSPDCGYAALPLLGEGMRCDLCAFYSPNASSAILALVDELERMAS